MSEIYLVGGTTLRTDLENYVSANISKENAIKSMREWEKDQGDNEDFHIDSIEIDDIEEFESQIRKDAMKEALTDVLNFYNDRTIDGIKTDAIDIIRMLTIKVEQMKEGKHE